MKTRLTTRGKSVNVKSRVGRNYLFHNRGRAISQSELGDALYSHDNNRGSNAIEALIGRLRKKIKTKIIVTRRGFGYIVAVDGA